MHLHGSNKVFPHKSVHTVGSIQYFGIKPLGHIAHGGFTKGRFIGHGVDKNFFFSLPACQGFTQIALFCFTAIGSINNDG